MNRSRDQAKAKTVPAAGAVRYINTAGANLDALTDTALADAARQAKIEKSAARVLSAESLTWSDGSLGCPEPDKLYTQALVPGYRIRVDAGGRVFDYHASVRGAMLLCPAHLAIEPAPPGAGPVAK